MSTPPWRSPSARANRSTALRSAHVEDFAAHLGSAGRGAAGGISDPSRRRVPSNRRHHPGRGAGPAPGRGKSRDCASRPSQPLLCSWTSNIVSQFIDVNTLITYHEAYVWPRISASAISRSLVRWILKPLGEGVLGKSSIGEDAHRHLVVGEPVLAVGDGRGLVERRAGLQDHERRRRARPPAAARRRSGSPRCPAPSGYASRSPAD